MGCNDSRAVSAVTISDTPTTEAEKVGDGVRITEYDAIAEGIMDNDGVFYGGDGFDPGEVTLGEHLLMQIRTHAAQDRVTQVDADTDESMSYRTLLTESVQVAEGLTEKGLGPGDTVAFFTRNVQELFPAFIGCVFAGVTAASMVPTQGSAELRHQIELCKPKVMFVEPNLVGRTEEALKDYPSDVEVISLQSSESPDGSPTYVSLLEAGIAADPDSYAPAAIPDRTSHVAFVLYSSGTTGLPKGVQISNARFMLLVHNIKAVPTLPDDMTSILALAPISWVSGVILLIKAIGVAQRRIFMTDPKERKVLSSIQKYKIQLWPTAPSVLLTLCSHPAVRFFNFSSLRVIMSGGGPLSTELQTQAAERLSCIVLQGYGSTEAGLVISGTMENYKFGALGTPEPFVKLKLVDLDTNEVVMKPGGVGELRILCPWVMLGYIGNPEATAECYDEEGWFRSGDLMYYDSEGYFFYVDRLKEMIKFGPHQVAPTEVEAMLLSHPGVKDACVLGLPHPIDGEHPAAFVVKSKKSLKEQEVVDFIAEKMSDPKRLRGGVIFIEEIPRTTTAKPMRAHLKQVLLSHHHPEEE